MLIRPDSQNFTRFLASLGLFLCAVAILAPALVLRETDVLRIPASEIDGLTPGAQDEILRRQRLSADIGTAIPYVGIVIFVFGLGLVLYAAPRLRRQEEAQERRSTAELEKLLSEMKPQDEQDRRTRAEADVRTEFVAAQRPAPSTESRERARPSRAEEQLRLDLREWTRRARQVEEKVLEQISSVTPPTYEMRQSVKIVGPRPLLLDGILVSKLDQFPDIVVEVKLVRGDSVRRNLRNRTDEALATLARYRSRSKRQAVMWLVMVLDGGDADEAMRHVRERGWDAVDDVVTSVIAADDIATLAIPFEKFR